MKENLNTFCIDHSKSKNKHTFGELKSLRKQYNSLDLKHDRNLKLMNEIKARVKEIEKSLYKNSIIRSKANDIEKRNTKIQLFFLKEVHSAKSKRVKNITHNIINHIHHLLIYLHVLNHLMKTYTLKNLLINL